MVKHGAHGGSFIGMLARLYDDIKESFADNIDESIEMHMVKTFIIDKMRFVVIFYDIGIGSINDMAAIKRKDTMILKLVGGCWKSGREFSKKVLKSRK